MPKKNIITWDLGATKCAAACVLYDETHESLACISNAEVKVRSCHSLAELVDKLELALKIKMADADAICIGAAGQYDGTHLQLDSGYPYSMGFAELAQQQGWPRMEVIHDYSPIVCATFTAYMSEPQNLKRLNTQPINPRGRRVALGVGTGLGLKDGILFANGDFWLGTNEMGHIGIPTPPLAAQEYQERHIEFLHFLRSEGIIKPDEPCTFEKVLSGQGLVRIHAFYKPDTRYHTPEETGLLLQNGKGNETLALFAWYLGLLIGTVQLTFMPDGGIWLTGGIILKYPQLLTHPSLMHGIESSPAYLAQRQQFPLGALCNEQHAFMGGAYYAVKRILV